MECTNYEKKKNILCFCSTDLISGPHSVLPRNLKFIYLVNTSYREGILFFRFKHAA